MTVVEGLYYCNNIEKNIGGGGMERVAGEILETMGLMMKIKIKKRKN